MPRSPPLEDPAALAGIPVHAEVIQIGPEAAVQPQSQDSRSAVAASNCKRIQGAVNYRNAYNQALAPSLNAGVTKLGPRQGGATRGLSSVTTITSTMTATTAAGTSASARAVSRPATPQPDASRIRPAFGSPY